MTGSGKTGLSISLLEEAAIDGIRRDHRPKGDLTNLLLRFPTWSQTLQGGCTPTMPGRRT
jgi:hypothetical protein